MGTRKLDKAKNSDEFYTLYETIEKGMNPFKNEFRNKCIYCNCDSPNSNFVKYFSNHFEEFGLKKLVATGYSEHGKGTLFIQTESSININELQGDGGYASSECESFLTDADIVITNPPYSQKGEYISHMMQHDKKIIALLPQCTATRKDIFPYFQENKLWFSKAKKNGGTWFEISDSYDCYAKNTRIVDGKKQVELSGIKWITNIDFKERYDLYEGIEYNARAYDYYDNYDAIDVNKVKNIPSNYDGIMGVPITFLFHINPHQFRIVGFRKGIDNKDLRVNGKDKFTRMLIQYA